ncbi:MAG TPA: hypothetical protein VJ890_30070 [Vineibacter sp.]|nr:hypothetical protein [Vineibacter sp.]
MGNTEAKPPTITPTKEFDRPADVLRAAHLSRNQKIAVLKQWELDARLLQTASEEGMSGGEPNMLAEVKKALSTLGAVSGDDDAGGKVPTKTGM